MNDLKERLFRQILPLIGTVNAKLEIDVIGPLEPCSMSGNRFILSVIDFASHIPIAYHLKMHFACEVVRCFIDVFTIFGFPGKLFSDCGSEFTSELMQSFFCLSVRSEIEMKSSPYYPQ